MGDLTWVFSESDVTLRDQVNEHMPLGTCVKRVFDNKMSPKTATRHLVLPYAEANFESLVFYVKTAGQGWSRINPLDGLFKGLEGCTIHEHPTIHVALPREIPSRYPTKDLPVH